MNKKTLIAALVVAMLLALPVLQGCTVSQVASDSAAVINAANIVITASQNYRDWGADLNGLLELLNAAGVQVPTTAADLAAYLVQVAEAVKAIEAGGAPPAAATHAGGPRLSAGPRTRADVARWVEIATTPGTDGQTVLGLLARHTSGAETLRAFHVDEQR